MSIVVEKEDVGGTTIFVTQRRKACPGGVSNGL